MRRAGRRSSQSTSGRRSASSRARFRVIAGIAWAIALAAAACGSDGRTLDPPPPGATIAPRVETTTTSTTTVTATTPPAPVVVPRLFSPAFRSGDTLPVRFTCDGTNDRPELSWVDIPVEAIELAIVTRRFSDNALLWVVTGIDPLSPGLPAGQLPAGVVEHSIDGGEPGWQGPCPSGDATETYEFTLGVMASASEVTAETPADEAAEQVDLRSTSRAFLSATYP